MALLSSEGLLHLTAWFFNVSSSVLIVVVNKYVMSTTMGCGFVYATTLCALHFLFCAVTTKSFEMVGFTKAGASLPFVENLIYSSVSSTAITCANLSLLLNSVGFYQIAKLLIAPVVCGIDFFCLGTTFSVASVVSIALVVLGVAIVTVTDVTTKPIGIIVALIFVLFSAVQQIYCGVLQRKHGLNSTQLLSSTAPLQFALVGALGPSMDWLMTKSWVLDYEYSTGSVTLITLSCAVAVLVNISQFMCLGRFSATTFSVMGHAKTILVLTGGVVLFREHLSLKELCGMSLAVLGMVGYSYFASKHPASIPKKQDDLVESKQPLLDTESQGTQDFKGAKATIIPTRGSEWYQGTERTRTGHTSRI